MKQIFKFICCGNVDDGKSTLIGRMLLDTGNVKKDQLEDAKKASLKNGSDKIELAMLLDGLLSEREQQITIDIAHRYFDYHGIRFHILDCPGHKQYTKNMAIAAAEVDTAIVVIDVTKGIQEQTEKHIQICSLFGLKNICVCLTKCDLILNKKNKPDTAYIRKLERKIKYLMENYSFNYTVIPVSAVTGYNVDKVLNQICEYAEKSYMANNMIPERILHIQAAKLFQGTRYYYAREVNALEPDAKKNYTIWPNNIPITITKNVSHGCFQIAENIDVSEGDCISNCPVIVSNQIHHQTIWFEPPTESMLFKHGTRVTHVVHYSDELLELDSPIIFNNLNDVKQNGFGIFIDVITRKTLGCCVFMGNKLENTTVKNEAKIYIISAEKIQTVRLHAASFIHSFNLMPVVLDVEELKKEMGVNTQSIYILARVLKQQGHNVIILSSKGEIPRFPGIESVDLISLEASV